MRLRHRVDALLLRALAAGAGALPWAAAVRLGERLGDLVGAVGVRRGVALANLAAAFPERPEDERRAILSRHYRELGRVACEYPHLPEMVRAPIGERIARVRGLEHLDAAHAAGRGVLLLTGHFSNFELTGAWLGRRHPVSFVVKPLANPAAERWITALRERAGVGRIGLGAGLREIFAALGQGRWVAMVGDQDARADGVFVPFLGRPASTASGPAEISIRTGAPILMGFTTRRPDRRVELDLVAPLWPHAGPDAARDLTARHAAILEEWVRRHPALWFWLHRRWKTAPRQSSEGEAPDAPVHAARALR